MGSSERITSRLLLVEPTDGHEESYRSLLLAPEVSRWLRPSPLPPMLDPEPSLLLARDMSHWREHGFGPWAVFKRRDAQFVGRVGLGFTALEGRRVLEVAWAISPCCWGRGFAGEAGSQALQFANELQLGEVISFTTPDNLASRRVMEKIGLRYAGEIERAGLAHVLFRAGSSAPD
jgi:RimJ/RimL family protein N-acetyltransferase